MQLCVSLFRKMKQGAKKALPNGPKQTINLLILAHHFKYLPHI